jgi:ABC-type polysaccharide/polyol phosphate export permease
MRVAEIESTKTLDRPQRPEPIEGSDDDVWEVYDQLLDTGSESAFAYMLRAVSELKNVKFALASFVVNNLRRRYRRSILGFAWSLLNPLMTMAVMTTVFSLLWHADPKTFGVYIFTGLLPWTFITDAITTGSQSIVQSEAFLKKVYIPKAFFPLVAVSTETANFVFSLASLVVLSCLVGVPIHWTVLLVPAAVALLFVFNFSVALVLAITTVYFRDLTHIIKVGLSTLFYLVPIIYSLDMVPQQYRALFLLNPLYYFIDLFRLLICNGVVPNAVQWLVPTALSLVAFCLAFYTLVRTDRDLIYRL